MAAFLALTAASATAGVAHSVSARAAPAARRARHKRTPPYRQVLDIKRSQKEVYDGGAIELGASFEEPVWLGPDEILAHAVYRDGWLVDPYRVNLRTGRAQAVRTLRPEINGNRPPHWSLSPDRQWLLWMQSVPSEKNRQIVACRIDGTKSVSWKPREYVDDRTLTWIPGSHRFVGWHWYDPGAQSGAKGYLQKAFIYDMDTPQQPPASFSVPPKVHITLFLGFQPNGRAVFTDGPEDGQQATSQMQLVSFGLSETSPDVHRCVVHWPGAARKLQNVSVSPNGKTVAWEFAGPTEHSCILWTTNAASGDLRRIGTVPGTVQGWYPDSRAVLVENRDQEFRPQIDKVYRVPIP